MITPKAIPHLALTEPQICSGSKSVLFFASTLFCISHSRAKGSEGLYLCAPAPGSESEVSHRDSISNASKGGDSNVASGVKHQGQRV